MSTKPTATTEDKPKATATDTPPAATKDEVRTKTEKCAFCGADKPVAATPGQERYETDANGEVVVNEYCPQCGRAAVPDPVVA
jgi:ribosomal protein S27AE